MKKGLLTALFGLFTCLAQAEQADFGAWTLDCSDAKPCAISQLVMGEQNGQANVVGGVTYFHFAKQQVLKIRFSPNAQASKGVGLKIDNQPAIHLPVTSCDQKVCEVNVAVDMQLMRELREGNVLSVAFIDHNQHQTTFPIILNGFKSAHDHISHRATGTPL